MSVSERAGADAAPVIVYVVGAGHSGSTLLSLLLNSHSRVHALGEIDKIDRYAREPASGRRPLERAFWRAVRARYEATSSRPLAEIALRRPDGRRLDGDALAAWADDYERLARAIAAVSGKRILVDASKHTGQLDLLVRSARFDLRVIHLQRDGRGVVHSYARKYGGFVRGYRHWARSQQRAARIRSTVASSCWLSLRYEDLSSAPERQLRRVCEFLDLEFEPAMLAFRRTAWEGVSGNRMAHQANAEIVLDERWRRELSWGRRALFEVLGGRRNARCGY